MVTYRLEKRNGDELIYRYLPERDESKGYGRISVDIKTLEFKVLQYSPCDVGMSTYARMAILSIKRKLEAGDVPEEGYNMWY